MGWLKGNLKTALRARARHWFLIGPSVPWRLLHTSCKVILIYWQWFSKLLGRLDGRVLVSLPRRSRFGFGSGSKVLSNLFMFFGNGLYILRSAFSVIKRSTNPGTKLKIFSTSYWVFLAGRSFPTEMTIVRARPDKNTRRWDGSGRYELIKIVQSKSNFVIEIFPICRCPSATASRLNIISTK